jgi:hypothetical protein
VINKLLRKIETGGIRNEQSLTQKQIQAAIDFAVSLGMPADNISYSDNYYTGYNPEYDILLIGTDLYPVSDYSQSIGKANSRVSWKGAIAHELVGHREAALKCFSQTDREFEETQASIRAARFTRLEFNRKNYFITRRCFPTAGKCQNKRNKR